MRRQLLFGACGGLVCALGVSACGVRAVDVNRAQPDISPAAATSHSVTPAATASCGSGSGFALSLVSNTGGQPTPVSAAYWFARHGGVPGIPKTGWRQASHAGKTAEVESGHVTLHVIEGPDDRWQVDSGETCS
jgi:hypothetical protein